MLFGIICASDDELAPFLLHLEDCEITKKAMLTFYQGKIGGISVVALYSGVCKVNAAIAAQILIDCYRVDLIINAGVAGGIASSIDIFDTVISTQVAYHDMDAEILTEFHPWMSSIWFEADRNLLRLAKEAMQGRKHVYFGKMVTGEIFVEDQQRPIVQENYQPLTADMETAGIAHVCYVNHVPFIAVRTVTDNAAHTGQTNFELNCKRASVIAKDIVLDLMKTYSYHFT